MALDARTLLAPPFGTGELEPMWFDWLDGASAVIEKLEGYKGASDAELTAAGVEITDEAETAGVYVKAYNALAIEYGRRVGATSIANEVSTTTGSASVKPFADALKRWQAEWAKFIPVAGMGSGQGVSASVRTTFTF